MNILNNHIITIEAHIKALEDQMSSSDEGVIELNGITYYWCKASKQFLVMYKGLIMATNWVVDKLAELFYWVKEQLAKLFTPSSDKKDKRKPTTVEGEFRVVN